MVLRTQSVSSPRPWSQSITESSKNQTFLPYMRASENNDLDQPGSQQYPSTATLRLHLHRTLKLTHELLVVCYNYLAGFLLSPLDYVI